MSLETTDETVTDRLADPAVALDLLVLVGYVAVAVAVLSRPGVYRTPLAAALGLPLVFFAPGYALVSLLFPDAAPDDAAAEPTLASARRHGLSGGERAALGFGISVAALPVLGIAISASPLAISPATVLLSVSGFAVVCAVGATVRRLRRPADRRFSLPVRGGLADARRAVRGPSLPDAALNVALTVAVVAALAAVGYAVAAPGPSQSYTDVHLLSQNETGQLVAADYPENFTQGDGEPVVVGLENHEGESMEYTVVVELQRVEQAADGSATVLQDRQLAAFSPTVEAGETWQRRHDVTPTMTGEDLRLVYMVYRGEAPEDPTTENADEYVHVWIDVSE